VAQTNEIVYSWTSSLFPEVLEVMKIQMLSHRSAEYRELHKDTVKRLAEFLEARKATVLLIPA